MFYSLLFLFAYGIENSATLKCYQCGEESLALGDESNKNIISCEKLDKQSDNTHFLSASDTSSSVKDSLEHYFIECPEEYQACVTQFKGKEVTARRCDTPAIDDCETANGITYCYCSQDLCNNAKYAQVVIDSAHKSLREVNYPSDDEDYMDTSGHHSLSDIDNNDNKERYEEKKIILSTARTSHFSNKYSLFLNLTNVLSWYVLLKYYLLTNCT